MMMHMQLRSMIVGCLLPLAVATASANSPTAEGIMEKAHHAVLYQGHMMPAFIRMTITGANGNKRKRQF
jgi:hypothetical protein